MWRGIGTAITVTPAQAGAQPDVARNWHHHHRHPRAGGAQKVGLRWMHWIPACAGTTIQENSKTALLWPPSHKRRDLLWPQEHRQSILPTATATGNGVSQARTGAVIVLTWPCK